MLLVAKSEFPMTTNLDSFAGCSDFCSGVGDVVGVGVAVA